MSNLDHKTIAFRISKAHSEAAGNLYLARLELAKSTIVIDRMLEALIDVTSKLHQATHDQADWRECSEPSCSATRFLLEDIGCLR